MTQQPFQVGLIGRGIGASRSPRMHEREAAANGFRLTYTLFDFAELELAEPDLPNMLETLERKGFAGTNVTHPYKQAIMQHLDALSTEAENVGAVNTVAFRDGRRIGYNTDVSGFEAAFRQTLDRAPLDHVVQIGAGGAGSATAYALLELGTRELTVCDLDELRVRALIERLTVHFASSSVTPCTDIGDALARADGIVNATPMGMAEYPGMPIPDGSLQSRHWVADVVYFPLETALLAAARRTGCRTMNGGGMAVWQAAGAFEIFTGLRADPARMMQTFLSFDS